MLIALLHVLACWLDVDHCSAWVVSHGRLVCAEVRLDACCLRSGWHETAQGVPVCVRECEEGKPTT